MARTVIVGDIHGMLPELVALLDAVGLTKADRLVSAGDLVDKGPESAGVVSYLRKLREDGQPLEYVMGNHEEKHARFRKALAAAPAGVLPKIKGAEEILRITQALSPEDVAFLDSAVPVLVLPEHNAVVVHAGILPDMQHLPSSAELAAMSKGEREKFNRVLRVRHVRGKRAVTLTLEVRDLDHLGVEPEVGTPITLAELTDAAGCDLDAVIVSKSIRHKGEFLSLGAEGPDDPFWADVYDGRFGHVYFGHSPYPDAAEPVRFPHATGLDLGCVFGGRLAAAVLEAGKEPRFVSVPARGKFATGLWEDQ